MESILYHIDIKIHSLKSAVTEIEKILADLAKNVEIPEQIYYNIMIAFSEAINNGLIHGNLLDPNKFVSIKINANQNELECYIQDQGDGFDPQSISDPREPQNLLKDNGRGVFLIRELCDEFEYTNTGEGMLLRIKFILRAD